MGFVFQNEGDDVTQGDTFRRQSNATFGVPAYGHGRFGFGEFRGNEAHVIAHSTYDERGASRGASEVGETIVGHEKRFTRASCSCKIGTFREKQRVFVTKQRTEYASGFRIILVTRSHQSTSIGARKVTGRNPREHEGHGINEWIRDILRRA